MDNLMVQDIVSINGLIRKINSSIVTRSIYNSNPKKTIFNLVIWSLNNGDDFNSALALFRSFDFDLLFGDVREFISAPEIGSWEDYLQRRYAALRQKWSGKPKKVLTMLLIGSIQAVVPSARLRVASLANQTLRFEELAFVLKTITHKIAADKKGKPTKTIARNYFLCDGYKAAYAKKTKRRLNAHKLAAITALLTEYGFITKANYSNKAEGKYKANVWGIGPNNPYYAAIQKKIMPTAKAA